MVKTLDKDETKFYELLGIDKEAITKKLKDRNVLDMKAAFDAIKNSASHQFAKNIMQETEQDAKERQKRQRLNAFAIRYLEPLITESFINDYDKKLWAQRLKIDKVLANKIWSWTPETPFAADNTKRKRAYYLAGPSGVGKSTLMQAQAIFRWDKESTEEKLKPNLVKYISLSEFFSRYYSTKEDHIKNSLEYDFISTIYLYIDDIGAEKFSEGKEDLLKNMLQRRIDNSSELKTKWTFFSSNYLIKDLPYNQTIIRRIEDLAREITVGESFEKKQSLNFNSNFTHS